MPDLPASVRAAIDAAKAAVAAARARGGIPVPKEEPADTWATRKDLNG